MRATYPYPVYVHGGTSGVEHADFDLLPSGRWQRFDPEDRLAGKYWVAVWVGLDEGDRDRLLDGIE